MVAERWSESVTGDSCDSCETVSGFCGCGLVR